MLSFVDAITERGSVSSFTKVKPTFKAPKLSVSAKRVEELVPFPLESGKRKSGNGKTPLSAIFLYLTVLIGVQVQTSRRSLEKEWTSSTFAFELIKNDLGLTECPSNGLLIAPQANRTVPVRVGGEQKDEGHRVEIAI